MAGRCMTSSRAWQLSTNANTSGPGWSAVRNLTVTTTNRTVYGYELCFETLPRTSYTPQVAGSEAVALYCTTQHPKHTFDYLILATDTSAVYAEQPFAGHSLRS